MAPEILFHRPYDYAVDIFACGIVAIEMAEGNVPHQEKNKEELKQYYKENNTTNLPEENSCWSKDFHEFLDLSLAVDPIYRSDAQTLLEHSFIAISSHITRFEPPLEK